MRMSKMQEKELKRLADFLNFKFEQTADGDRDLPQQSRQQALAATVSSIIDAEPGTGPAAAILQAEARRDLGNLIKSDRTESSVKGLGGLLEKINSLGLTPTWVATPVKQKLATLKVGHRKGRILTPKFGDLKTPTEKLYSIILVACADGSLSQLRECKQCGRVFIQSYQTKKFCRPACTAAFNDANAAKRQRKRRQTVKKMRLKTPANDKRQDTATGRRQTTDEAGGSPAIKAFATFLNKSEKPHREQDTDWLIHFKKIAGVSNNARWTVIYEWLAAKKRGEQIEAIWKQLPKGFRESF